MDAYKFDEISYKSEQLKALTAAGFDLNTLYALTKIYGIEVRRDGRGIGRLWYSHPFHFRFPDCNGVGGVNQVVSFFCPPFGSSDPSNGWVDKNYQADANIKKMAIFDLAVFGKRLGFVKNFCFNIGDGFTQ